MSESNTQLIVRQELTPSVWSMVKELAPVIHQSRLFGIASQEAAAVIMLKGFELGLPLTASFEFIAVVEGKPTLSPRGALAIIHRSGELTGLKIDDQPDACTVWMKRRNGFEYSCKWTMDDARRAGVVKPKGAWETYPANMLKWRAVGFCADVVFPDLLGGMKRADEMGGNISPDGDVIEGEWQAAPVAPPMLAQQAPAVSQPLPCPPVTPAPRGPTLDDLVQQYGAEQILVANEGRLPESDADVAALAEKLGGNHA